MSWIWLCLGVYGVLCAAGSLMFLSNSDDPHEEADAVRKVRQITEGGP